MNNQIIIENASENNLKNICLQIPHHKLIVVTGVSGSGKSSLVYDVICREGQRLFMENFLDNSHHSGKKLRKPHVDKIEGLYPVISVNQQAVVRNPRSTVGTLTEIYDYLRLLFARLGNSADSNLKINRSLFSFNLPSGQCPVCKGLGVDDKIDPELIISDAKKTLRQGCMVLSTSNGYIIYSQVTIDVLDEVCKSEGFSVDILWNKLTEDQKNIIWYGSEKIKIPFGKHTLESRMKWTGITAKPREEGYYKGILPVMEEILKRDRNPNILRFVRSFTCPSCSGKRLNNEALSVMLWDKNIADFTAMSINHLSDFFSELNVPDSQKEVVSPVKELILNRTHVLKELGLGYLTLDRESTTLSGGESQRIKLGNQAATGLRNVLYVLDEPSAGLHAADHHRLMKIIQQLVFNGNTVIVVEHDKQTMMAADWIIDLGPGPGEAGGELLYNGSLDDFINKPVLKSITQAYLTHKEKFDYSHLERSRKVVVNTFGIENASKHNLKNISVSFHEGCFNVVTGVSGSGKSSLIDEFLEKAVSKKMYGTDIFKRVLHIDQSPIGRTPKSNPATYTGMSDHIRDLFATLPESKNRDYKKGQFSFVVKGGRCEACEGAGVQQVGMHFLGNIDVICDVCEGKRFSNETLEIKFNEKSISDILELSILEGHNFFKGYDKITRITETLIDLGLGYIKLGQPSTTLSGGEAQRVKLATELSKTSSGKILYILDEPTTGLHLADIKILLTALQKLKSKGNTILAIEHHSDFILSSDFVVDLGTGSGEEGGSLVFSGTPFELASFVNSVTGQELNKHLSQQNNTVVFDKSLPEINDTIQLNGITTNNLKNINVEFPLNKITGVTGVSGSGKSSLVFDTLKAESQRRFNDGLSSYIRQFIGKTGNAKLNSALGLTPSISLEKKRASSNPRSIVATFTGLYDLYRLLFSRVGNYPATLSPLLSSAFSFNNDAGACTECKGLGKIIVCDPEKIVTNPDLPLISGALKGTKTGRFYGDENGQYVAALISAGKTLNIDFSKSWNNLLAKEKQIAMYGHEETLEVNWNYKRGNVEGTHTFKNEWKGFVNLVNDEYLRKHADGRGEAMLSLMKQENCPACKGKRLKEESLSVIIAGMDITELTALTIDESAVFFEETLHKDLQDRNKIEVANTLSKEILSLLQPMQNVGLGYISADRLLSSLSGGEFQRLQLAAKLKSGLTGITYLLDEPSFGLHPTDVNKVIPIIQNLRDSGNTVVMVEQSDLLLKNADKVIEMGPKGGNKGGQIIAQGSPEKMLSFKNVPINFSSRVPVSPGLKIKKAHANNLKNVNIEIPLNDFVVISGVSGSGKTSLLSDVIFDSFISKKPLLCEQIEGFESFKKVIYVEQETPFSSHQAIPATYLNIFDTIRDIFTKSPEAVKRKYKSSHFSFHTKDGQCPTCSGAGSISVSLDYWTDARIPCEQCHGKRYKPEILEILVDHISIGDLLNLSFSELNEFLEKNTPSKHKQHMLSVLQLLKKTGLEYLSPGQSLHTLSTGELQRLKLIQSICESKDKKTLLLLDEPTGGLHSSDTFKLLSLFNELIEKGNTIICVTHEPILINHSDWLIETGPGAGKKGGEIVYSGNKINI